MRFTNETGLIQVLKYSSQRLTRILTVPVTNGYRKVRRALNPNGFTTRVMADVRTGSKELINGKPQSLKDYFSLGNYYIAKKLAFIIAVLLLVLPVLYLKFLHPVVRSNFLTATMVVNSAEMVGYSGKVQLLAGSGGTVLYRGPLVDGRITGEGKLYDYEGNLAYQGAFLMEQYEGSGQTFWPNGKARYVGSFAGNQYEGRGTLYTEDGSLLYEGSFAAGLYDGEGILYQNGDLLYRGRFKAGQMAGEGKLYSGSLVIYEGGFADGTFGGAGREYDPVAGHLIYDGVYVAGKYEGQGRQFDAGTGMLTYEGGFYQGAYEGEGKSYDPQTQLPLYEGGFRAGRHDGEGVEYDPVLGAVVYRGGFLLGFYHGAGIQYDPATGFVTAAGQYRNGQPVVPGEDSLAEYGTLPSAASPAEKGTAGRDGDKTPPPETSDRGQTQTQPEKPPAGSGGRVYQGPKTAAGGIDYTSLAKMTAAQVRTQFSTQPNSWSLSDGDVLIYTDQTEGIGLALRTDSSGKTVSLDVWNDASVAGAKAGASRAELNTALGAPAGSVRETMGEGRMISISQSNRYFGRLTNLSPESKVTVYTYQTGAGTIRAVFAGSTDQCLLLEILP